MAKGAGKARKVAGTACMVAGVLLIAAAAVLLLYNRSEDVRAGDASEEALAYVTSAIAEADDSPASVSLPLEEVMPVATIDGNDYVGYIAIPVLGLELPVMAEWDLDRLKIAPCRYFGSTATDDLVICGHNYDRHFGRLKNLQPGDIVTFTRMDGISVVYEVVLVETLQPTQISEMIESDYDLSLYTCTYGGASRVTVRCNRVQD